MRNRVRNLGRINFAGRSRNNRNWFLRWFLRRFRSRTSCADGDGDGSSGDGLGDCANFLGDNGFGDCCIASADFVLTFVDNPDGVVDVKDDCLLGFADLGGSRADGDGLDGGGGGGFSAVAFEREYTGLSIDDVGVGSVDGVELEARAGSLENGIFRGNLRRVNITWNSYISLARECVHFRQHSILKGAITIVSKGVGERRPLHKVDKVNGEGRGVGIDSGPVKFNNLSLRQSLACE